MWDYFIFLFFVTIIFIIYIEFSVGNILYRINSDGFKSLNCGSMINFLLHPFHNSFLWSFKSLDINYPFILFTSSILYFNLK